MPNDVMNSVMVNGPMEELMRMRRQMIKPNDDAAEREWYPTIFDFAQVIPRPTEKHDNDWADETWGTKWNAYCLHDKPPNNGEWLFSFYTAWSVPVSVYQALAVAYPKCKIDVDAEDPNLCWRFKGVYENGEAVKEHEWDYEPEEDEADLWD